MIDKHLSITSMIRTLKVELEGRVDRALLTETQHKLEMTLSFTLMWSLDTSLAEKLIRQLHVVYRRSGS